MALGAGSKLSSSLTLGNRLLTLNNKAESTKRIPTPIYREFIDVMVALAISGIALSRMSE